MKKTFALGLIVLFAIVALLYWNRRPSLNVQLFVAAAGTNTQEVARLISHGADVNMISTKLAKHTPLMMAVQFGDYDMAALLLSKGADPNRRDGTGESTLFSAMISRPNSNVVRLLVENGAQLSEKEHEFVAGMRPDDENKQAYDRQMPGKPSSPSSR